MNCMYMDRKPRTAIHSILIGLLVFPLFAANEETRTASETIDYYYEFLLSNIENPSLAVDRVFSELFDMERLAPQAMQNEWAAISPLEKQRFIEALAQDFRRKILAEVELSKDATVSSLKLESNRAKSSTATLQYSFKTSSRDRGKFTVKLVRKSDGWKITDLRSGNDSLLRSYYNYCRSLIEEYSFAYMLAQLGDQPYVVLEDFESSELGELPPHWVWKNSDNDKNKPYEVKEENGNRYLAAEDNGESVILGRDIGWNLKEYPYISFRWRIHKVPAGGDERYGRTVDSAAGVYVTYKKKLGLIPVSVKYVWSSTLPVGAATQRSGIGRPWYIVAGSGEDNLGEWQTFVFNAYEAYKDTFGGEPPDKPLGVGILSDANSTNSAAYADYDDIRALRRADADSGVKQKLKAE